MIKHTYKQHGIHGTYDAIVIGSGMGGLTTASLLARYGRMRVLVLERHYEVGGYTHSFRRPGYEWDVGVHYIGQTQPGGLMRRFFDDLSGGALDWADMGEVYDEMVVDGQRYEYHAGYKNFRKKMIEYFPDESEAIDGYLDRIRQCSRVGQLLFAEKLLPTTASRLIGSALRYPGLRLARRTTREVLESLTDNQRLIAVLTGQFGDYGLPPSESSFLIHSLVASHYLGGASYPVGGSAQIAETIVPAIRAAGGDVMTSAEVDKIVFEKDRAVGVQMADGKIYRSNVIISGAGVNTTYGSLLPDDVAHRHGLNRRQTQIKRSSAYVVLYLGFESTPEELGMSKRNIWVYPTSDHEANLNRFYEDPDAPLPVTYLSFASAKDPDFQRRHPGHATAEVLTLVPYHWFEPWETTRWKRRGNDYQKFKEKLSARLLEELFKQCPQLRGKVAYQELSSPLSTRHFCNHGQGELYGLAHTPERFDQSWLRPKTPLQGLYLTGCDICTCGVGGALVGGILTASAVIGRNLWGVMGRHLRHRSSTPSRPATATADTTPVGAEPSPPPSLH